MPRRNASSPDDHGTAPAIQSAIRDRVIDFRRVRASDLLPNPKNFRIHNDAQRRIFHDTLDRVGFAGAELVRQLPDGRLMLIDGHMRQEELGDTPLPVLVTDLSEQEAGALLATFDPLGRLAGTDSDAAAALIESLGVAGYDAAADLLKAVADNDQTAALLEALADGILGDAPTDDEWAGALGDLPEGDKAPFQQMTFTLTDAQAAEVKRALAKAKDDAPGFDETGNANSNGNALAYIIGQFMREAAVV